MRTLSGYIICILIFVSPLETKGQSKDQLLEQIDFVSKTYGSNLDSVSFHLDEIYESSLDKRYFDVAEKCFYKKSYFIRRVSAAESIDFLNAYKNLPFELSKGMEAQINISLASAMIEIQDHQNALTKLKLAKAIFDEHGLEDRGHLLLNFGELHYGTGHYETASQYYLDAYDEFVRFEQPIMAKVVLYYYLDVNKDKVHEEPHLSYFEKYIKKTDSSYFQISEKHQSISIFNQTKPEDKIPQLNLLAQNLESKGVSFSYFEVAMDLVESQIKSGNFEEAINSANTYLSKAQNAELAAFEYHFNKLLAKTNEEQENFDRALIYYQRAEQLEDSLQNLDRQKNMDKLLVEFDSFKKDTEIEKKKVQNKILMAGLGTGGLIAALIIFGFMRRMRKNKIIRDQESQIQQQKIEQLEMDKKLLSMAAMIEGQEAERIRIAKDLHDGLGGLLSTVKLHIGKVQQEIKNLENLKLFERTQDMMDNACDEVRRISHNLMPPILSSKGLAEALRNLIANLNETQDIKFQLSIQNFDERLTETQEMFAYRIVQELINNMIKHSGAKTGTIQLLDLGENFQVIVEDDGVGFDYNKDHAGLGLKSIESRVEFLRGELEIESNSGEGTAVFITVPKKMTDA